MNSDPFHHFQQRFLSSERSASNRPGAPAAASLDAAKAASQHAAAGPSSPDDPPPPRGASTRPARRVVLLERTGWTVVTLDPARGVITFRRRRERETVEIPLAEIRLHALSLRGRVLHPKLRGGRS